MITEYEIHKIFDSFLKSDLDGSYYLPMEEERIYDEIHAIPRHIRNGIAKAIINKIKENKIG